MPKTELTHVSRSFIDVTFMSYGHKKEEVLFILEDVEINSLSDAFLNLNIGYKYALILHAYFVEQKLWLQSPSQIREPLAGHSWKIEGS